ncbi:hypothetical protein OE88DRAFT_1635470 [Heliocybe sulcata]|uniref:Uncharacterized protein n=1 Tax=Heliocybe sulcata TaxID=5364 RepID=A0A5C3N2H5_9AGAM|nr:hypothetical protein OE88DRAFT_1635470 [Heliocybe sulcata]
MSPEIDHELDILTQITCVLGLDELTPAGYTSAICALSSEEIRVKLSLNRLRYAEEEMSNHLASAIHEEYLAAKWTKEFKEDLERADSIATIERQKAALVAKAREYHKELEKVMVNLAEESSATISGILDQRERIRKKEQELKAKRAKIRAFKGLPPNLELARNELRNARQEQMQLIQLRERLLGAMAAGIS